MKFFADVVIVGGGISGITSAIDLAEKKKKVILLERRNDLGGLAIQSFGGIFFSGTDEQKRNGINDSPELALKDWFRSAEFQEDDYWGKEWAKEYIFLNLEWVYDWLKNKKIRFFPVVHWVERGLFQPGNSVPRFHMVWGTGFHLMHVLIQYLSKFDNCKILAPAFVKEILIEDKTVKGVRGTFENNENFQIEAPFVVIASGGILGNLELVQKHWGYEGNIPNVILNGAMPESDGYLHFHLKEKGAILHKLYRHWNYAAGVHHPSPRFSQHGLSLVPVKSGLWVNSKGERFGNPPLISAYDTLYLVREILKQEGGFSWHILNYKIAVKELAVSGAEFNEGIRDRNILKFLSVLIYGNKKLVNTLMNSCIDFISANSLEELIDKINELQKPYKMDFQVLKETIEDYDIMIERGKKFYNDDQLRRIMHLRQYRGDRIRISRNQKIFDKNSFPLIAIRLHILTRKTLGGIVTNLNSQVIDENQKPIEGLYAVGECAGFGGGGIHGIRSLEGTFLGTGIFTARKSASDILKKL